ncbi:MAG: acetolactate synthase small subunit [Chloroflexota bacterium]
MRQTIIALMEDKPGALSHVVTLFRRRNYNIESLAVGHSEVAGLSRLTVVVQGDERALAQIVKNLDKLINVIEVSDITQQPSVIRELALIKVEAVSAARYKIMQLVDIFRAKVIDVANESLTVEITGTEDKIDSLVTLLRPFGIKEMVRTGQVAMLRGENVSNGVSAPAYAMVQLA